MHGAKRVAAGSVVKIANVLGAPAVLLMKFKRLWHAREEEKEEEEA